MSPEELNQKYQSLSPGGVPPEGEQGPAVAAPEEQQEQLSFSAADISKLRELKAQGNYQAMGQFLADQI